MSVESNEKLGRRKYFIPITGRWGNLLRPIRQQASLYQPSPECYNVKAHPSIINWRCALRFTALEYLNRSSRGYPRCHATSIAPRLKFDLAITPNFEAYLSKVGIAPSSLGFS